MEDNFIVLVNWSQFWNFRKKPTPTNNHFNSDPYSFNLLEGGGLKKTQNPLSLEKKMVAKSTSWSPISSLLFMGRLIYNFLKLSQESIIMMALSLELYMRDMFQDFHTLIDPSPSKWTRNFSLNSPISIGPQSIPETFDSPFIMLIHSYHPETYIQQNANEFRLFRIESQFVVHINNILDY